MTLLCVPKGELVMRAKRLIRCAIASLAVLLQCGPSPQRCCVD